MKSADYQYYRDKLKCNFKQIDDCLEDYICDALNNLSEPGVEDYLSGASLICMMGRGWEPVSIYLEEMPIMANLLGEPILEMTSKCVWDISRTPNGRAIPAFLQSLPEASRRLGSIEQMQHLFKLIFKMIDDTTTSVHGHHSIHPSPGLIPLLNNLAYLLNQLSLGGLKNWIEYGVRNYRKHPTHQEGYFSLQSADSKALLQRERHGTLYMDNERKLDMYLRGLWQDELLFIPYSRGFDELRKPVPYYDHQGIRIPDVYDEKNAVSGIDRYRVTIAHIAAHRRWTKPVIADNYSPFQRIAIEHLEDSRIDRLIVKEYPGLRKHLLALLPQPIEDDCDPEKESCIRHRLAMLSRAILDKRHTYKDENILKFSERFENAIEKDGGSTEAMAALAVEYIARTRLQSDQSPNVRFKNTEVDYRDDNRHMWIFIEQGDEEEAFDEHRESTLEELETSSLPPRHYPEWDYNSNSFKPDWVSLYESIHPSGEASLIDKILDKHRSLGKLLKQILETLKPQQFVRVRYQEEGSELDLDVALRSLIDFKCGAQPDPRINMSHRHDGRDIAVLLLLDLSASLNEVPDGCEQTIVQLSQEAVSLLAWTIEQLGDKYAIAGFHSDTRHNVRYFHIKGFSEIFDNDVKGRLAAMDAGYSTRMGAAIRHASHYLDAQKSDKKLMLILTDGEPSDIDVDDEQYLISDTKKAVAELTSKGMHTYCISLDKKADSYIEDIFSHQYSVIDHISRLPEQLPKLFMSLTK